MIASELRVLKERTAATVTLSNGRIVHGHVFVSGFSATHAVSNLIREGKTFQLPSTMQVGKAVGMVSLNDALFELVTKMLVAPEEAHAKAVDKTGIEGLLKRIGGDLSKPAATRPTPATA